MSSPPGTSVLVDMQEIAVTSARQPSETLVAGVNWQVRAGDYWMVGALPGAGKTELLSIAAGLKPPARGELRLFDRSPRDLSEDELIRLRRRIGFVFPYGGRLFNRLSVTQNLALPFCYHENCSAKAAEERVNAILKATGLEPYAQAMPERVPWNLHPRVGLARALVLDPELLLLDNPLGGLDPPQILWWMGFLAQLSGGTTGLTPAQMTLIVSANDFRPWLGVARQFATIHEKVWALLGSGAEVLGSERAGLRDLLSPGGRDRS